MIEEEDTTLEVPVSKPPVEVRIGEQKLPHLRVVVAISVFLLLAYGGFSIWALSGAGTSPELKGDILGTWKSFAVAVVAFWIGASSGGKLASALSKEVEK